MKVISQLNECINHTMNHRKAPFIIGASLITLAAFLILAVGGENPTIAGGVMGGVGFVIIALKLYKLYKASTFQDVAKSMKNTSPRLELLTVENFLTELEYDEFFVVAEKGEEQRRLNTFPKDTKIKDLIEKGWVIRQIM